MIAFTRILMDRHLGSGAAKGTAAGTLALRHPAKAHRADNPIQRAEARFVLGDATWRAGDRHAGTALVKAARADVAAVTPAPPIAEQIAAWLAGDR